MTRAAPSRRSLPPSLVPCAAALAPRTRAAASPQASFTETGALWMLGYDEPQNAAMRDRLSKFGVASDVLNADDLHHKVLGHSLS